ASQVSMLACKNTILTHNLAIAVERLGSTDITEIMTNPKTLSGFVINVIATCTRTKNETGPHTTTFHETVAENLHRAFPMRYTGKASRGERDEGLSGLPMQDMGRDMREGIEHRILNGQITCPKSHNRRAHNPHPTIKPISLCT